MVGKIWVSFLILILMSLQFFMIQDNKISTKKQNKLVKFIRKTDSNEICERKNGEYNKTNFVWSASTTAL